MGCRDNNVASHFFRIFYMVRNELIKEVLYMFNKIMENIKVFFSKGYVITFESGDKGFIQTKGDVL